MVGIKDEDKEFWVEASRRGLLEGERKEFYDEAINRGMLSERDDILKYVGDVGLESVERGLRSATLIPDMISHGLGQQTDEEYAREVASVERQKEEIPMDLERLKGVAEIMESESVTDFLGKAITNPKAIGSLLGESIGAFAPGMAVGIGAGFLAPAVGASAVITTLVTGVTAGVGSGLVEASGTYVDTLAEEGVDTSDPRAIGEALQDEAIVAKAKDKAIKRGIAIGVFDALTMGIAGKFLKGAQKGMSAGEVALRSVGETAIQGAGGAAGEATAQIATEGSVTSPQAVGLEALLEIPTAIPQAGLKLAVDKRAERKDKERVAEKEVAQEQPTLEETIVEETILEDNLNVEPLPVDETQAVSVVPTQEEQGVKVKEKILETVDAPIGEALDTIQESSDTQDTNLITVSDDPVLSSYQAIVTPTRHPNTQKTLKPVYVGLGEHKPKNATDAPANKLFGATASYGTFKEDSALQYGSKVEERPFSLNNPLVITSDKQWREVTRKAGWTSSNLGSNLNQALKDKRANELQRVIRDTFGHDGVVIDIDSKSKPTKDNKLLHNIFKSEPLVVDFRPETKTPINEMRSQLKSKVDAKGALKDQQKPIEAGLAGAPTYASHKMRKAPVGSNMAPMVETVFPKLAKTLKTALGDKSAVGINIDLNDFRGATSEVNVNTRKPTRGAQIGNMLRVVSDLWHNKDSLQNQDTQIEEMWHFLRDETSMLSEDDRLRLRRSLPLLRKAYAEASGLSETDLLSLGEAQQSVVEAGIFSEFLRGNIALPKSEASGVFSKVFTLLQSMGRDLGNSKFDDMFQEGQDARNNIDDVINHLRKLRSERISKAAQTFKDTQDQGVVSEFMKERNFSLFDILSGNTKIPKLHVFDVYRRWMQSTPAQARTDPVTAKIVELADAKESDLSLIEKHLGEKITPLLQRKAQATTQKASEVLARMDDTNQDIIINEKTGLVEYTNVDDTVVSLSKEVSDTIITLDEAFKEITELYGVTARAQLKNYGLDVEATLQEMQERVDELNAESSSNALKNSRDRAGSQVKALEALKDTIKQAEDLTSAKKAYMPRIRFGAYAIAITDKTEIDPDTGKAKVLGLYPMEVGVSGSVSGTTKAKTLAKIREEFKDTPSATIDISSPFELTYNNMSSRIPDQMITYELIAGLIGSGSDKQVQEITDALKQKVGVKGIARHLQRRKNVKGYSTDYNRAIGTYFTAQARNLVSLKYGAYESALSAAVSKTSFPSAPSRARAESNLEYILSSSQDNARMRLAQFFMYLGANLSSAVLQLATTPTTASAYLTQFAGNPVSNSAIMTKALTKAIKVFGVSSEIDGKNKLADRAYLQNLADRGTYDEDTVNVLNFLWKKNKLQVSLAEDSLPGSTFSRDSLGSTLANKAAVVGDVASYPMQHGEHLSRIATATGIMERLRNPNAIRQALKVLSKDIRFQDIRKDHPEASDKAVIVLYAMDEVHALFGKQGRGGTQRGFVGTYMLPFSTYPTQMMELLYTQASGKRGKRGQLAAAQTIVAYAFLVGVAGVPGWDALKALYEIYQKFHNKVDVNFELEMRKMLIEGGVSPDATDVMFSGVIGEGLGIDIASRLQLPVPGLDLALAITGLGGQGSDAKDQLGMIGGLLKAASKGGTPADTALSMLPSGLKNPLTAVKYKVDGVESATGTRIMNPDEVSKADLIKKMLGFNPMSVSKAKDIVYLSNVEGSKGAKAKSSFAKKDAVIALKVIEARDAEDKTKADTLREERRELRLDIVKWSKQNDIPLGLNWWKGFNGSVNKIVLNKLRPDILIETTARKSVNVNKLRETLATPRREN